MSDSPGEPIESPGSPADPVSSLQFIYVLGRAVDFEGDPLAGETVEAKPLKKYVILESEVATRVKGPVKETVDTTGYFALKLVHAEGLSYRLSGAGMPKVVLNCDEYGPGSVAWTSLPLA